MITTQGNVPTSSADLRPSVTRTVVATCLLAGAFPVIGLQGITSFSELVHAVFTRAMYAMAGVEFVPDRFDHGVVSPLVETVGAIVGWMVLRRLIEMLLLGYKQWRVAGSRKARDKLSTDAMDAGFALIKPDRLSTVVQVAVMVVPAAAALLGMIAYKIYAVGLWPSFVEFIKQ
ncbi:hypothetical protein [Stenotrophomonas maltophilia]